MLGIKFLKPALATTLVFSWALLPGTANAVAKIESPKVTTKALEHMPHEKFQELVRSALNRKHGFGDDDIERRAQLKEALFLVLSKRETGDGIFRTLIREVRPQLDELEMTVFQDIVNTSAEFATHTDEPLEARATYFTVLDNLITIIENKPKEYGEILKQIQDKNLELDEKIKSYFFNAGQGGKKSPSERAKVVLENSKSAST